MTTALDRTAALATIAAHLDLRDPNYQAVESLAMCFDKYFDEGGASPYECIIDSATGVGKTYILAAAMEYFASLGGRNFAVVVPRTAILTKTVHNFTPGHRKSLLGGMDLDPVLITEDNFASPAIRAAMEDQSQVKLFIFTVQSLLTPTSKTGRKTHKFQEGLGKGFYEHLVGLDDLLVFADEHHCYYGDAFSKAVRGLQPKAIVGLTATPHKDTPEDQIIFRYPLSKAIGERLVKTPVLVGRKDDRQDDETKLRDGIRLLEAKQAAIDRYRVENPDAAEINPIMLVVAKDTAAADEYERIISSEDFLDGKWADHVLVVHSNKPEPALVALDAVEDPASPVRIIISVGMLKEGWDVKNVYVIASMRASVSTILTEQTLGRGLRLPFGQYTGWELLDTLEVLAHERYEDLLRKVGDIREAFVDYRTHIVEAKNAHGETVQTIETVPVGVEIHEHGSDVAPTGEDAEGSGVLMGSVEERQEQAAQEVKAIQKTLSPNSAVGVIEIPRLGMTQIENQFQLADITEYEPFEALGRKLAADPDSELRRSRISVHTDGGTTSVTTVEAVDAVDSSAPVRPEAELRSELIDRVRNAGVVPARKGAGAQLEPIVDAFLSGLGDDAATLLSAYMERAVQRLAQLIAAEKRRVQAQPVYEEVLEICQFAPLRTGRPNLTSDRTGPFKKGWGYEGFSKSMYEQEWFDSSTERDLANLLDGTKAIKFWARLQNGDLPILWSSEGQNYNPDLLAVETSGDHYVVEAKADRDVPTAVVQGKRKAAKRWMNHVNAAEEVAAKWHYLLVSETDLKTAKGDWNVLKKLASA